MKRVVWIAGYLLLLAVASLFLSGEFRPVPSTLPQVWTQIPAYFEQLVSPWKEPELVVTTQRFSWPVNGPIFSAYGWHKHPLTKLPYYHRAVDIGVAVGTPVRAAAEGQVSRVYYSATLGHTVIIQHSEGWASGYAHLDQILVGEGDFVARGMVIAQSGTTGLLRLGAEPHLHFMLFLQGVPVDPLVYLASEPPGRNLQ